MFILVGLRQASILFCVLHSLTKVGSLYTEKNDACTVKVHQCKYVPKLTSMVP